MTLNRYHHAVVVGIDVYPKYGNLKGPVADAKAFEEWLKDPDQGALPAANVKTVLTPARPPARADTAKPTKQLIDEQIFAACERLKASIDRAPERERKDLWRQSRLYLFFAGHGIMPSGGEVALLDAGARPSWLRNLEISSYVEWLRGDGAFAEVCVFADCCRSFKLLATKGLPGFDKRGTAPDDVRYLFASATLGGLQSFEAAASSPDDQRGHFSYALMEGLRGGAADPDTGVVRGDALIAYAGRVVAERTKDKPEWQRQVVPDPEMKGDIFFGPARPPVEAGATVKGRLRRKVTITFATPPQGLVELVAPDGETDEWDPADGPWVKRLYDGIWYVQHAGTGMDTEGFAGDGVFEVTGEDRDVEL